MKVESIVRDLQILKGTFRNNQYGVSVRMVVRDLQAKLKAKKLRRMKADVCLLIRHGCVYRISRQGRSCYPMANLEVELLSSPYHEDGKTDHIPNMQASIAE